MGMLVGFTVLLTLFVNGLAAGAVLHPDCTDAHRVYLRLLVLHFSFCGRLAFI